MMLLAALGRIVLEVGTPLKIAAVYAVARFLFGRAIYTKVTPLLFSSAIVFFPAWLYFALLVRIRKLSFTWLLVFVLGKFIGVF